MLTPDELQQRIKAVFGTQEALARKLSCAPATISRYLRGGCAYADYQLVAGIAEGLGCSPEEIYQAILKPSRRPLLPDPSAGEVA